MMIEISKPQIIDSLNRIKPFIHKTPVLSSKIIDEITGSNVFFKCENFQKAGSFKIRGASNAILQLSEAQKQNGVITHSSGNFAQAIALSAKLNNIKAYIVMPNNAPQVKVDAVRFYGAEIRFCENKQEEREKTMLEWQKETGATFLHPYNDVDVICGQSTCCNELINQTSELDYILVPIGGGGLISGSALATHYYSPSTKVIGCEPRGADDAWHSFTYGKIFPSNNPDTIADGLLTSLGDITFPIIRELVSNIITVTDNEIIYAMKLIWERLKIIVEPSSAITLAVVLKEKKLFKNKRVGLIISGGNVDLTKLPF